jgi:hypothetical protein
MCVLLAPFAERSGALDPNRLYRLWGCRELLIRFRQLSRFEMRIEERDLSR